MQVAVALALARVLVVPAVQQSQKSNEQHLPPELQKLWRLFQKNNCHVMALQIIKKLYVTGLWRGHGTAIGMGILPLALISFPMWIGNSFENKSIERLNFFWSKYK